MDCQATSHVSVSQCDFPSITDPISPSARQLVRQDGAVTAPRAGRGLPGWPMAAHQLASAYEVWQNIVNGRNLRDVCLPA